MSVYVDETPGPGQVCTMIADTRDELFAMARRVGAERKTLHLEGTNYERFYVTGHQRALAVELGAIEVSNRGLVTMCIYRNPKMDRRKKSVLPLDGRKRRRTDG